MELTTSLIRIQQSLYDQLREEIRAVAGSPGPVLQGYFRSYKACVPTRGAPVTLSFLERQFPKFRTFICGDHHSFSGAQHNFLWFCERVLRCQKNAALFLEAFEVSANGLLKKFLDQELSESEFLRRTCFEKGWGFDWNQYRPILDFARKRKLTVYGLNRYSTRQSSAERDRTFAAEIEKHRVRGRVSIVLVGDHHLSRNHLPAQLKAISRSPLLVLHQNLDSLYFKFALQIPPAKIVKLSATEYCLLSDPPWEILRSELGLYEKTGNELINFSTWEEEVGIYLQSVCKSFSVPRISLDRLQVCVDRKGGRELLAGVYFKSVNSVFRFSFNGQWCPSLVAIYYFLLMSDARWAESPLQLNGYAWALHRVIFSRAISCSRPIAVLAQRYFRKLRATPSISWIKTFS